MTENPEYDGGEDISTEPVRDFSGDPLEPGAVEEAE